MEEKLNLISKICVLGAVLLSLSGCANHPPHATPRIPNQKDVTTIKVVKQNVSFKTPAKKQKFRRPKFNSIMPLAPLRYHDLPGNHTIYSNLNGVLEKSKN